jgi:hypothetical protein
MFGNDEKDGASREVLKEIIDLCKEAMGESASKRMKPPGEPKDGGNDVALQSDDPAKGDNSFPKKANPFGAKKDDEDESDEDKDALAKFYEGK